MLDIRPSDERVKWLDSLTVSKLFIVFIYTWAKFNRERLAGAKDGITNG
jgi:hypothetical protein